MDERTIVLERIEAATNAQELFGSGDPSSAFRKIVRVLRPDLGADDRVVAAFAKLKAIRDGETVTSSSPGAWVLSTKVRDYKVGSLYRRGDIANLYEVEYERDGRWEEALVKMPRAPQDNDLMMREVKALQKIDADGDPDRRAFIPRLVDTVKHRDAKTRVDRRVNVLERPEGRWYTLAEVRAARTYRRGLDGRDAAWMFRRLLIALGDAHNAGVVHGAVTPNHVLIHPGKHGLVLVDWCYSSLVDDDAARVPALAFDKRFYPPEVLAKERPAPATDVFMAARCLEYLLGERTDSNFRAYVRGHTVDKIGKRPGTAWGALENFDEVIRRKYGERRFRPFLMPENDN